MPLDLIELKRLHDKAYLASQTTRERASDDFVFYWITQWDDSILDETQLSYRGEFDVLRKAGRQIMGDLKSNPVQVDFIPKDETREDSAEVIDGLYRADCNKNTSIEAFNNGQIESVVCGVGAWELATEYATKRIGDKNQVIVRKPIIEANNTVFWDPNAKLLDKSDAKYVSVLTAYSKDGYKDLVNKYTGEDIGKINASSFKFPEHSYTFPWILGEADKIYIVKFYHREIIEIPIITLSDPFGNEIEVKKEDLEDYEDDLIDAGYEFVAEHIYKKGQVTKYIASGKEILTENVVPGEYIPVIPTFGEHAFVEGEEHWEGVTRLAKDPQRLRNFAGSYLGDILSRSPRNKPIFWQEQIAGLEDFYSESGADNNYPYYLMNRVAADGTDLPLGPISEMPEQRMPTSLPAVLELSREAVEDVANPGIPQDIADPDISGRAVYALQARLDMQSMVYQDNTKHAKRRDGVVYTSIAAEIYDVPRTVQIEAADGTRQKVKIMEEVVNPNTGEIEVIRNINNTEFEVYSKIGPSFSSQREQTIDRLSIMIQGMPPGDPMRNALQLKQLTLMDGIDFEDIRDYANKLLVIQGIKKPSNPEEKQALEQSMQKSQEPDAATLLAQAENKKGDADLLEQKRKGIEMQIKAQNDRAKVQVDEFDAQTKRMEAIAKAKALGVDVNTKRIEKFGKELDNTEKIINIKQVLKEGRRQLKTGTQR